MSSFKVLCFCAALGVATAALGQGRENRIYKAAVVALTHDPKLDNMALLEALKSPAFYVGALGSKLNNDKRRARVQQHFDITAEEAERLHGPVGLPIGSRTPPEIAVAILAEMTAVKNGVAASFTRNRKSEPATA